MVNDLVFEDRRTHLLLHLLVLLHEFKELTLLTRVLTRLVHDRLGHFRIGHLNFGVLTQLCQQEPQTHAARGQRLVLFRCLDLGVVVALHVRVFFMPKLVRNLARFCIQQRRRQVEIHQLVQRIQKPALHDRA